MIAYTKPKKVEVFYYTGDTPEWVQWQLDNNVTVKHPQVNTYVIINGGGVYYMTDEDFHEEYHVPMDVSGEPKQPYYGAFYSQEVPPEVISKVRELYKEKVLDPLHRELEEKYLNGISVLWEINDGMLRDLGYEYDSVCWSKNGKSIGDYKDGYFVYTGDLEKRGRQLKTYHDLLEFEYE